MSKGKSQSRNLQDFRALHDINVIVPNKIKAGIEKMLKEHGPEHWEYESDFIPLCGLSQTQMGQFREQFTGYWLETPHANRRSPRRVWFATTKAAKEAAGD